MSRSIVLTPAIEAYAEAANRTEHPVLARCREETVRDLPDQESMLIGPLQAAFMQLLAHLTDARDAIEVGVFTGYSAMATALAMQDRHGAEARLIACDHSEDYMARALTYFEAAALTDVIEPRIGPAAKSLDALIEAGEDGRFDLAFIDADKTGYDGYYEQCLKLLRPGGAMAFDNVLWDGDVADTSNKEADTEALRAIARKARVDERVDVAFTTVGDGLLVCVKR
ncbi:MAG: class I SAM-dependent methyltransferase [Maricaulaceae bacterium]|jgi:caffeoyl-CoA O-methyltransferase